MGDEDADEGNGLTGEIVDRRSSPNLARDHINMAVMFAEKAESIEETYTARVEMVESETGQDVESIVDVLSDPMRNKSEYRFYSTGAVIAAAAFVEACINELIYQGTSIGERPPNLSMKNADILENIHDYTDINLFYYGTLRKYKLVFAIADEVFDTGGQVYENIRLVLEVRNRLMHHQPKFDSVSGDVSEQRLGELRDKFDPSPFYGGLYFPYQCMSFGCARWAIESCLEFTEYFYSQIGVSTPYRIPESAFEMEVNL